VSTDNRKKNEPDWCLLHGAVTTNAQSSHPAKTAAVGAWT